MSLVSRSFRRWRCLPFAGFEVQCPIPAVQQKCMTIQFVNRNGDAWLRFSRLQQVAELWHVQALLRPAQHFFVGSVTSLPEKLPHGFLGQVLHHTSGISFPSTFVPNEPSLHLWQIMDVASKHGSEPLCVARVVQPVWQQVRNFREDLFVAVRLLLLFLFLLAALIAQPDLPRLARNDAALRGHVQRPPLWIILLLQPSSRTASREIRWAIMHSDLATSSRLESRHSIPRARAFRLGRFCKLSQ